MRGLLSDLRRQLGQRFAAGELAELCRPPRGAARCAGSLSALGDRFLLRTPPPPAPSQPLAGPRRAAMMDRAWRG